MKTSLKIVAIGMVLVGAGCSPVARTTTPDTTTPVTTTQEVPVPAAQEAALSEPAPEVQQENAQVTLPVDEYAQRRTLKTHGEYIEDRFTGYHVGDDIEYTDVTEDTPVYAIADGEVTYAATASGYGGVIIIAHTIEGQTISAVYGHVDIATANVRTGDTVQQGQQIAVLGDHESSETDGERKHLHFSLYTGSQVTLAGYTGSADAVNDWINPQDFFADNGVALTQPARQYNPSTDRGGDIYQVAFTIPEGFEVEYVPSIDALNLYEVAGSGTARERSQLFIRYFDASDFLTLSTVTIYTTTEQTVGAEAYEARRYDIEKNAGVADFADQPSWRNERHIVTDFRGEEGFTRYYVVAANPTVDEAVYAAVLDSMSVQ